jgi:hypothetical protein
MSISVKFAAVAFAASVALPAVASAHPLQEIQPPVLEQVARSTVPNQIVPILFDPADSATAALMGGLPLTTVYALTSPQRSLFSNRYVALVGNSMAQSESHVPTQGGSDRQAAEQSNQTDHGVWFAQGESREAPQDQERQHAATQTNQDVIHQGTWLAAFHPGNGRG